MLREGEKENFFRLLPLNLLFIFSCDRLQVLDYFIKLIKASVYADAEE